MPYPKWVNTCSCVDTVLPKRPTCPLCGRPRERGMGVVGVGGGEVEVRNAARPPAYFDTLFHAERDEAPEWPEEFVILSAHATTGDPWSEDKKAAANEALYEELVLRELRVEPLTGYDLNSEHAWAGYAVVLPLDEAIRLGRLFRQVAIFHVLEDVLSVTRRDGEPGTVPIGRFRERLEVVAGA